MSVFLSKLWVLLLLTVCRLASGLCPLLVSRKFKRKRGLNPVSKVQVEKWVGYSMDFSGGLLLATCFLHMLPEVRDHLMHELRDVYTFPYAETLVCAGFFIVFVIEESVKQVARHSHRPLDGESALIPARRRDQPPMGAPRADREMSPLSTDLMAESCAANGASGGAVADVKFIAEADPMMKEGLALAAECNNNTKKRHVHTLKNVLLVSALSFHSVMEGLAIGLALDAESVWYLFFAVSVHECTILLCVGIELVTSCPSAVAVVLYMTFYALVSPAGVLCGTLMTIGTVEPVIECLEQHSSLHLILVSSLQGLAAGTILYVTFFEVLNNNHHHHDHHHHRSKTNQSKSSILKLFFVLIGFLFMVFFELLCEHGHKHSPECDGHSHDHTHPVNGSSP